MLEEGLTILVSHFYQLRDERKGKERVHVLAVASEEKGGGEF